MNQHITSPIRTAINKKSYITSFCKWLMPRWSPVLVLCEIEKYVNRLWIQIGEVRTVHTLAKVLLELGCLYLAIIMSNYSRLIVPVKKLQFPPGKTNKFENVKVCSCADMPRHEGHVRTPCCYVRLDVIAYVCPFFKLCIPITWDYRLTNIHLEAYMFTTIRC